MGPFRELTGLYLLGINWSAISSAELGNLSNLTRIGLSGNS